MQIQNDPDLLQFALAEGKSAFGDNCAPCHGAGGQGAQGYPNLNDDVWLWGGKLGGYPAYHHGRRSLHQPRIRANPRCRPSAATRS